MPELPPFQQWFVELISMISNVLIGAAAVAGIIGLRQWRRELIGKTKFEIAHKIALLALQAQNEFSKARNPLTLGYESAERPKHDNETPEIKDVRDEHFARIMRLKPLSETLTKLEEASWEAELLLDGDIEASVEPLSTGYKKLYASIQSHFRARERLAERRSTIMGADEAWADNLTLIIYGTGDDEFSKPINNAITDLKSKLKQYLRYSSLD